MHNVRSLTRMKGRRRIAMLTAYDFLFASLVEKAGADIVLCGDSLGMVFNGHKNTLPVTVDEMIYHAKAVRRGAPETFLVVDMPFMSYQVSKAGALRNAGRIMKETGAEAVKLEGGSETAGIIKDIVDAGIPVMAHIGTQPQSVNKYGGYVVSGADDFSAQKLEKDAKALENAGAFCVVMEKVKAKAASAVTAAVRIPSIGIGAGPECDGQVLVTYDLLGFFEDFSPKFVKKYDNFSLRSVRAMKSFIKETRNKKFPGSRKY